MLEKLKERVCEQNLQLVKYGLVVLTWGNVSALSEDGKYVVIKPSGVSYDNMKAGDMVVTDRMGNIVEGDLRPSTDLATHLALYDAFPGIGGAVHTHSRYAVAAAQAGLDLPCYGTTHADYFYGAVPCARELTAEEIEEAYERNTGLVIAETIAGNDYYINYDNIPVTTFLEPEISWVGYTVADAEAKGIKTISGSLAFSSNEKAIAIGKTEGVIKVVAREDDHTIIGAQIFGHEACDLIAEMTVAVENKLTLEQVYNSIHPHPTVTEIILEVCKRAVGLSFDKA